jgi:hypothetical protein
VPQQPAREEKGINRSSRIVASKMKSPRGQRRFSLPAPLRTRAPGELSCLALAIFNPDTLFYTCAAKSQARAWPRR